MGFSLTFELPAALATSYALPTDFFTFWHTVEPFLYIIIARHPHRAPDHPLDLLRAFRDYMLTVPKLKDNRQRWRSISDIAAHRPARKLPYWQQYDPLEDQQVPYVAWFLIRFSRYITQTGFDLKA
jgi:hypothetical protein